MDGALRAALVPFTPQASRLKGHLAPPEQGAGEGQEARQANIAPPRKIQGTPCTKRRLTLAWRPGITVFAGRKVSDALPGRVAGFIASDHPRSKHNPRTCAILHADST